MSLLGEALRSLRVFHDLSQTDVADKLRVSKSYVSEVESGKKEPTLSLLTQYSGVFAVPLSSLIFFSERVKGSPDVPGGQMIAPKILRLLDWISEVKQEEPGRGKKPPKVEIVKTQKFRVLRKTS